MKRARLHLILAFSLTGALAATVGCSGSNSSSGGGGVGLGPLTSNVQPITVNTGPAAGPPLNAPYIDGAFTSVTICVPGSASSCQTISGVLVDTGSSGLRLLSSAVTIPLPPQTVSGNPIAECLDFADGSFTWGTVATADVQLAGEKASSLPIQVIGGANAPNIPNTCSNSGMAEDDLLGLGANGILGVGNFAQDCGTACTVSGPSNPGMYYVCPATGCQITTESLSSQLQNPVSLFPTDNNGVIIQLPSVTGAETSVSGSLIFGIGTQSNNALGSATVYTFDPVSGNFTTVYHGVTYTDASFLDSGSNGIYFLDTNTTGFPVCADATFWYCPSSTQNLSATNQGANGATGSVDFVVGNADTLTTNAADAVVNGLAGPNSGLFDWGLPFFFGRSVFTAIEGKTTPGGTGPYWAF